MAKHVVKSVEDIRALATKNVSVGDIVDHKRFEPQIFSGELKKVFPESEVFTATVGTDIYALHGVNVSMIIKLQNEN